VLLQTRLTLPVICYILIAALVCAAPEQASTSVAEIQSVLTAQQDAWNRGDIDAFMNGYARSASTVFVSQDEVSRGWETVRDRYRVKYSDRTKMGTLSFSEIKVTMISLAAKTHKRRAARTVHTHLQTPAGRLAHCSRSYKRGEVAVAAVYGQSCHCRTRPARTGFSRT